MFFRAPGRFHYVSKLALFRLYKLQYRQLYKICQVIFRQHGLDSNCRLAQPNPNCRLRANSASPRRAPAPGLRLRSNTRCGHRRSNCGACWLQQPNACLWLGRSKPCVARCHAACLHWPAALAQVICPSSRANSEALSGRRAIPRLALPTLSPASDNTSLFKSRSYSPRALPLSPAHDRFHAVSLSMC